MQRKTQKNQNPSLNQNPTIWKLWSQKLTTQKQSNPKKTHFRPKNQNPIKPTFQNTNPNFENENSNNIHQIKTNQIYH